jgi:elongation factor G
MYRYIEPLPQGSTTKFEFDNMIVGQVIPSNFIPSIEKGFKEAANS